MPGWPNNNDIKSITGPQMQELWRGFVGSWAVFSLCVVSLACIRGGWRMILSYIIPLRHHRGSLTLQWGRQVNAAETADISGENSVPQLRDHMCVCTHVRVHARVDWFPNSSNQQRNGERWENQVHNQTKSGPGVSMVLQSQTGAWGSWEPVLLLTVY